MKHQKYKIISCNVMWRELCYFAALSTNEFAFKFLPWGLHCTPDQLRIDVQKEIDDTEDEFDAILLGYGLCSKGLEGITAGKCKLVITRGHDCITCFLGSKEKYREYFDAKPGTYWYTPGWIENHQPPGQERYEDNYASYLKKYGEDNAQYLMEMEQNWFREYSTAAYVDLGISNSSEHEEYTQRCADWLKWEYDRLEGDPKLFMDFVGGEWSNEVFLVVEPGSAIEATNDDFIMKSVRIEIEQGAAADEDKPCR